MPASARRLRASILSACVSAVCAASVACAQDAKRLELPSRDRLHFYLLMGGDNMSGRGEVRDVDRERRDRVVVLGRKNKWRWAQDPLHYDESEVAGVGPGLSFGRTMARRFETIYVGLVPCAQGASSLKRWEKGGDLYGRALTRARIAMKDGTLKGVLWHHGELDARRRIEAVTYGARLKMLIRDLRHDLKLPKLPFIVAKFGTFARPTRLPYASRINTALSRLPAEVPLTGCVDTQKLGRGRDLDVFSNKAARELGSRYYSAMIRLLQKLGEGNYDSVP